MLENDLKLFGHLTKDVYFKDKTSIRIGGKMKYFIEVDEIKSLQNLIKYLNNNEISYFVLGNGTNLLVSDEDFDIVVISLKRMNKMRYENEIFIIEAGVNAMPCGTKITLLGYMPPLCLAMVPGTIGGAIYMNASAYGEDVKKYLQAVDYITPQGELIHLNDLKGFGYRTSPFQTNRGIIVRGYFKFDKDNNRKNVDLLQKAWAHKKNTQPLKTKNAGCIFKNPPSKPAWNFIKRNNLDKIKIGDAAVSEKHHNFLINLGEATFFEMHALIEYIQKRVYENDNELLELEIRILKPQDIIPYQ